MNVRPGALGMPAQNSPVPYTPPGMTQQPDPSGLSALELPEGQSYGNQPSQVRFAAGEGGTQLLCESRTPARMLWRVSATGNNMLFSLSWGTRQTRTLSGIRAPLRAIVAGRFFLEATPIDPAQPADATSTMTATGGGGLENVTTVQTALAALPLTAYRATALAAATITLGGFAGFVMVPGQSVLLAAPSALTAGGPLLLEHHT